MLKKNLIIILVLVLLSSCKSDAKNNKNENLERVFNYKNLSFNIPVSFKKDTLISNRWINKNTGVTLNIEVEYSETELEQYVKDAIKTIKRVYPNYEIIEKLALTKKVSSLLARAVVQNMKLKFYMLIISLEKSKVIITIGGRENVLKEDSYKTFIDLIKIKDGKNESCK